MEKLPEITKAKQVGKNLNVIVAEESYTITGSAEELAPVKEIIKTYKEKPTKSVFAKLIKLLTPKTTAVKEKIEKEETKVKSQIKVEKQKEKTSKKAISNAKPKKEKIDLVKELRSQKEDGILTDKETDALRALLAKSEAAKSTATQAKADTRPSRNREY
jgi:hypothetical protein